MRSIVLFFLVTTTLPLLSNPETQPHSQSPYFIVESECAEPGSFPLCSTTADVVISGPIADVTVTQRYSNAGEYPIEAMYVFPASGRAAVYDMEMRIGSRIIKAEIMEKQAATQTYEQAREEGKRASLLEQSRPNVFQMHVANIMPGEQVDVVLRYTEFIIPEEQVYSFVYPTVVGPRYVSPQPEVVLASTAVQASPANGHGGAHTTSYEPTYLLDVNVRLKMPVPIAEVNCTTHKTAVHHSSSMATDIALHPIESKGGNRDFVLSYRLAGDEVMSGALTYRDGDETYFLCQIEPPALRPATEIVPREYIFILDVSGSMNGYPLDVSKNLIKNLLADLRPIDRFNILFFAGSNYMMFPQSASATSAIISSAFGRFNQIHGGGGTELLPALRNAMRIPKSEGYARSFVIATDGYVMVEPEAFQYISEKLGDANFFAFGIGNSVNRHLIEGIAHVGRGEPFIVTGDDDANAIAERLRKYIESPLMTDIEVKLTGADFIDVTPANVPDLLADRPIHVFGKFKHGSKPEISVAGLSGTEPFNQSIELTVSDDSNSALKYLWAREKIRYLSDFNVLDRDEARIEEITQLGIDYNLLTEYTSFVAVDHEIVNTSGQTRRINQPLPLPQGVSPLAVGFEMDIPGLISHAGSMTIDVDVRCEDADVQLLVESMLELVMQDVPHQLITRLVGSEFELTLKPDLSLSTNAPDDCTLVIEKLRQAIVDLKPVFAREYEVTVAISIINID